MLILTGQVLNVIQKESTNRQTGVISPRIVCEILHTIRGDSVIEKLSIDPGVADQWRKFKGQEIKVEVRTYAMKGEDGTFMHGFSLADKKGGLPTLLKAA